VALYVGLAVVLVTLAARGEIRSAAGRAAVPVAAVLLCAVPFVVGLSRLYRGMHYLTDVIAGGLAGGLWMVVVLLTLLRLRPDRLSSPASGRRQEERQPTFRGARR
jgi:membrane-associated phospholipid phosphatase